VLLAIACVALLEFTHREHVLRRPVHLAGPADAITAASDALPSSATADQSTGASTDGKDSAGTKDPNSRTNASRGIHHASLTSDVSPVCENAEASS
jgi:hypothetical protein